jgi:hypothetical protein
VAPIAWSDVTAFVSTLSTVNPTQQELLLEMANTRTNVDIFDGEDGIDTKLARIYLVAHFASLPGAGSTAPAGPLIGQTRGKLSQQFQGLPLTAANEWLLTQWGRRYWQLLQASRARWMRVP